jgi:aminoglycoside phosphotransferase family enzyme
LHLNNICYYEDKLQLFDCIEFNDSFRFVDVMYDLAFTTMDLDFNGRSDLARLLLDEYTRLSNDYSGLEILPIYQSRQAYVRAKVISFQTNQIEDQKLKNEKIEVARKYYELALDYLAR